MKFDIVEVKMVGGNEKFLVSGYYIPETENDSFDIKEMTSLTKTILDTNESYDEIREKYNLSDNSFGYSSVSLDALVGILNAVYGILGCNLTVTRENTKYYPSNCKSIFDFEFRSKKLG